VADLKKGHLGVFEVCLGDRLVYTNRMHGGRLPTDEEIIEKIREYQERPRPSARDLGGEGQAANTPGACGCG
jgi:hypothetical protein